MPILIYKSGQSELPENKKESQEWEQEKFDFGFYKINNKTKLFYNTSLLGLVLVWCPSNLIRIKWIWNITQIRPLDQVETNGRHSTRIYLFKPKAMRTRIRDPAN